MEEERMLNDEILLGLIKSNSGGGGGTSDYEQLSNLPKIDGVELKGNKTAAQLGLATEQDLSGKQNALTAGDYIQFEGNEISVKRTLDVPTYVYNIKTPQHPYLVITKTLNGEQVSQTTYSYNGSTQQWTIDDLFTLKSYRNSSDVASWRIELISDAHEHDAGWAQEWDTNVYGQTGGVYDFDLTFDTIDVSGQTLVIKSEMDTALSGKQNTLTFDDTPTDGSNNPVKSNGIYDALATKADLTDLAPAFSTATAYTVGQYVSYGGNIYKCTSEHSAGAWVAGDFTLVAVGSELEGKQDTLTFDDTPTQNSTNPVKSGGVYSALGEKADTDIVASDFDATASYTEGNYCIYEGKFYKFKASHSGAWSAADVDEIKIAGELSALKSGLTTLDNEVNGDAVEYPYADVITIEDAVPSNLADCKVKIEPDQNLHGFDHPWVGGAGKNKLNPTGNGTTYGDYSVTKNTDGSYTVTGGGTGEQIIAVLAGEFTVKANTEYHLNGCPTGGGIGTYRLDVRIDGSTIYQNHSDNGSGYTFTADEDGTLYVYMRFGRGYAITGSVTFYPMICLASETDKSYAPYTNICPITGHTEASVQRVGKNLCGELIDNYCILYMNGQAGYNASYKCTDYIKVYANETCTISNCTVGGENWFYDINKNPIGNIPASPSNSVRTFTPTEDCYIRCSWLKSNTDNLQIELGSSATDYEPFKGKTYTIALGDTIYGGTVDFDSGVMTVTHKYVDLGDYTWSYNNNNSFYTTGITDFAKSSQTGSYEHAKYCICEKYKVSRTSQSDAYLALYFNTSYSGYRCFVFNDPNTSEFESGSAFKTYIAGTHICYELNDASTFTIQLTPAQIQLLKGTNTLTASTGQISVTVNGVSGSIGQVQEQVNDHEERIEAVESDLTNVSSDIEELQAYTGYGSSEIIGVEVDYVNKSFRRLGAAVGKNGGSDFDSFTMFGGRRRCNVADDGTISKYYGDAGYAEDGSNGQVMVYQPKFYYKMVPLKLEKQSTGKGYHIRKAAYYVTATPLKGFKVHPAFVDASGNELEYVLIGASKGCIYDVSESAYITDDSQVMDNTADKFSSIFGVKPASGLTQDLTRPKIEQMCQNRGANWHELNVQMAAMTELLMLIEYGKFDMQRAIGKGVVDISDNSSYNCSATSGSTSALGNASGRATSTTIVTNTSTTYTDDGKTSITYRGEEDPYGDMWEFVMGMNVWGNGSMNGGEPYICSDYNYAESKNDGNYKGVGFTIANSDGYVNAWGYGSEDFDWLFMASEAGGSDALPVGDYLWKTANLNDYRIARLGAGWNNSWKAGAFSWIVSDGVGNRNRNVGGRLAYLPA